MSGDVNGNRARVLGGLLTRRADLKGAGAPIAREVHPLEAPASRSWQIRWTSWPIPRMARARLAL